MFYKPKFCCECGNKIERVEWQPWTSRRFCEECEKPFEKTNRIKIGITGALIFVFGVFASQIAQPTRQPAVKIQQVAAVPSANQTANPQTVAAPPNSNAQSAKPAPPVVQPTQSAAGNAAAPPVVAQTSTEEAYFCGARTQKGTPCSRRVRGGGRCWQHTGKPAILPVEKLLIR